ncbi:hypothetical protein OAF98_05130 [Planctomicrobium sp.]|jgi:hypothetical protein|nr:hypothetical protein [Planctomicrobium sp.]MDB4743850.1 hypothetical protein [Planctomicrobium sp.]
MYEDIFLTGQLDPWPRKTEMVQLLQAAGFSIDVGRYSIRINDCEHFVFQEYGGDLGEPQIDADASSLEKMLVDAGRVSTALISADIRHRFELYDELNEMVGYLHHKWSPPSDFQIKTDR